MDRGRVSTDRANVTPSTVERRPPDRRQTVFLNETKPRDRDLTAVGWSNFTNIANRAKSWEDATI